MPGLILEKMYAGRYLASVCQFQFHWKDLVFVDTFAHRSQDSSSRTGQQQVVSIEPKWQITRNGCSDIHQHQDSVATVNSGSDIQQQQDSVATVKNGSGVHQQHYTVSPAKSGSDTLTSNSKEWQWRPSATLHCIPTKKWQWYIDQQQ